MGRNKSAWRNEKKGGRGGKKGGGQGSGKGDRYAYVSIPSENAKYERYYKESGLIPEEEWDEFWATLKRTLPTTFRFTGSKGHALSVLKTLQEVYVPHLSGLTWEDQPVSPPTPLPWFPDNLAWTMTAGKTVIRRCPPFKRFQNFLVAETTVGNISRQEAVSMIPPLLMDIEPHHAVLDMCAAPGSKTAQLIEAIHAGEETRTEEAIAQDGPTDKINNGGRPTGLVIANDADYKRSHMLIHQTKRLNSPNLIVTNHDATWFPSLLISGPNEDKEYLKYDRILADVPCTGDGTARKNYGVWRDWSPGGAFNLHLTQVRILVRGLQMLKVGGRIIYSTCSMNPVENEAVLASAIDRCGGLDKVNIVNVDHRLPELKRRPGVTNWKVFDRDCVWFNSFEEVEKDNRSMERLSRITREMFPTEDYKELDDPTRIPLERAIRVYPHLQDTGGFFIAVLEKKMEIKTIKPEISGRKKMVAMAKAEAFKREKEDAAVGDTESVEIAAKDELDEDIEIPEAPATPSNPEPEELIPGAPESPIKRKLEIDSAPPTPLAIKKTKLETEVTVESEVDIEVKAEPEVIAEPEAEIETEADAISAEAHPMPSEPWASKKDESRYNTPAEGKVGRRNGGIPIEEPFKFLAADHPALNHIFEFYSLSSRFPRNCFLVRNAEGIPSRAIYFTCDLARQILTYNEGKNLKFVHCGVKAFFKQDVQELDVCPWRIQNEGLPIIEGWIGEDRIVRAKKRITVRGLLKELFPKVNAEGHEGDVIAEIEQRVRELSMGCCILKVGLGEGEEEFDQKIVLPLWRSRFSCNLMLPKDERRAMLMRLFNDEEEVVDSTNKNRARPRANTNSELPDGEVLPDSEVFPDIEDAAEVDPELEVQDIEGEKPDL
ncbi:tRNA (cytosine-5-)-methyltransferase ncl1 [Maublancomyces gigas]|uniref:tRNA (Cytosine-5-)-methyltransferase ncl1 n=1 Tax=Discina gigas TaxID=1032678 RepID=A0ABR3GKX7_9PEZI